MTFYSQKDSRWSSYKYYGNNSIGASGCFVVSLAMLDGRTPPEVADIIKNAGGFASGGLLISDVAASALGLEYNGKSDKPDGVCIAETDHYKNQGYPQHFFVYLGNGLINDPLLDHGETVNNYRIKSYRLFRPKGEQMCKIDDQKAKDMRRHLVYLFIKTYYHREPTEKEVADHADWIDRDSGDSFNYKGMAEWVANQVNEKEFKANWVSKKEYDNATKVAQEKCNATIANIRSDYTKEIDRLTKIIKDKDDDIVEIEAILKEELKKSEKKVAELEKQLNGLTERVVYESLIWNWIKKLFRKE